MIETVKKRKMKRVKINAWQAGLVFKNGVYSKLLKEGTWWFWGNVQVYVYDITKPFVPFVELGLLLQDEALASALEVVDVAEGEIVLQFENGLLKQVLTAGRHAFWKGVINYVFVRADITSPAISEDIDRNLLQHRLLVPYIRISEVQSYERALLFVDGRYVQQLEPGVYHWWKNAVPIQVVKVDNRRQQLEINGQEILTKDKAALRINAWAQYGVKDMEKAVLQNKDHEKQLYVSLQLALREYIGGYSFDELLEKKEALGTFILQAIAPGAEALGIEVSGFGIRDIILPGDVKEIMNGVLIAEKKAQANSIMRREETASTRSLLNTARLMEENSVLWKLKEMEYIERIADKVGSISVSGNDLLAEQLKKVFVPGK